MRQPFLSVIVNFHNMHREAPRTLFSLSGEYQADVTPLEYEVVALDNGSDEPLDPELVRQFGDNFSCRREEDALSSPCAAINRAVRQCRGEYIAVVIDGARILSPGILGLMKRCFSCYRDCFGYTLAMHLGPEIQNLSVDKGYNAAVEDELLASVDWRLDGRRLFEISSLAASSGQGFFSPLAESNCVGLSRGD